MDWLDQDLFSKEGKEVARENDNGTSYRVTRRVSNMAQGRDISSSRKGTAPKIISSSFSSDDGENRTDREGSNIGEGSEDSKEDTSRDNGVGGGIEASGVVDGGYVNQVYLGMSWA